MARKVKPPDQRRIELLDIGIKLFMDNGIDCVSIKDIVSNANVATGLFYYYFTSKEAFVEEAVNIFMLQYVENLIATLLLEELPATEKLFKILTEFEVHLKKVSTIWQINSLSLVNHHVFEDAIILQLVPLVQSTIECGVHEGVFKAINPAVSATFILNGLSGILHMNLNKESLSDNTNAIRQIVSSTLELQIK